MNYKLDIALKLIIILSGVMALLGLAPVIDSDLYPRVPFILGLLHKNVLISILIFVFTGSIYCILLTAKKK